MNTVVTVCIGLESGSDIALHSCSTRTAVLYNMFAGAVVICLFISLNETFMVRKCN